MKIDTTKLQQSELQAISDLAGMLEELQDLRESAKALGRMKSTLKQLEMVSAICEGADSNDMRMVLKQFRSALEGK